MADETPELTPAAAASGAADDDMRFWLAIAVMCSVSVTIALAFLVTPKVGEEVVGIIIGQVLSWPLYVLAFFFGSSSGSKMKSMQQTGGSK